MSHYRAWRPDEEWIDDGADYPSDVAECPEIAAALYAIHYARRWLTEPATLTIAVRSGDVETDVRVDVDSPPRWRVRRAERIES